MDDSLPLSNNDIDRVTDFVQALHLWATGGKNPNVKTGGPLLQNNAKTLSQQYSGVYDAIRKGNINLTSVLVNTDPDAGFLSAYIRFINDAGREDSGRDGFALSPHAFKKALTRLEALKEAVAWEPDGNVNWMDFNKSIRRNMEEMTKVNQIAAAELNDPQISAFNDISSKLYEYVKKLKIPGKRDFEQDEAKNEESLIRYLVQSLPKDAHPAHDAGVVHAIDTLAAAITIEQTKASETDKVFFERWLEMNERVTKGTVPASAGEALERLDSALERAGVGSFQRDEIKNKIGEIASSALKTKEPGLESRARS